MPIYEYRCGSCGHEKEVLQKMSDAPLTVCPACGKDTLRKQISAAGFQLKGSGWYATDFRGGSKGGSDDNKAGGEDKKAGGDDKAATQPDSKAKEATKAKEETKSDAPASGGGASSA